MSFVTNSNQQISFSDPIFSLTARERKFLDKSWASQFAEHVFPLIDEKPFSVLYSDNPASRPNTPVNILVGASILKENFGMTDDDMIEALMFDIRYQVALHTTSFEEAPLSDKSLERFRRKCLEYEEKTGVDLIHDCITGLGSQLAVFLKISGRVKRMDSMMIESNIRKMSRLELLYTCVANMVRLLHKNEDNSLITGMEHYYSADDRNRVIYRSTSEETSSHLEAILADAKKLIGTVPEPYADTSEWILLKKVVDEQTIEEDGKLRLKTREEGLTGKIQNPYDPEATYRKKAGESHIGYSANLVEDVAVDEDGKVEGSMITEYDLQANTYSDSQFMKDMIDNSEHNDETVTVITDGAFGGSEENASLATEKNINLVPTDLMGKDVPEIMADFKMNEDGTAVLECPAGYGPKACSYNKANGVCRASFYCSQCSGCRFKEQCHPKEHKRTATVFVSKNKIARAEKQKHMKSEEYKKYGRIRNGVETVPSMLRRFCNIDNLPVRGRLRIKQRLGFMIGAVNFRKFKRQRAKSALLGAVAATI